MYVVAIKDRKAWVGYTPAQISMVGFWNLIIVWLKVSARFLCWNLIPFLLIRFSSFGACSVSSSCFFL
jgi:hypothetical protein